MYSTVPITSVIITPEPVAVIALDNFCKSDSVCLVFEISWHVPIKHISPLGCLWTLAVRCKCLISPSLESRKSVLVTDPTSKFLCNLSIRSFLSAECAWVKKSAIVSVSPLFFNPKMIYSRTIILIILVFIEVRLDFR